MQDIHSIENINTAGGGGRRLFAGVEDRQLSHPHHHHNHHDLKCPRCDSSNTKFCYYNNYNLSQPRHFCKTCRRYWTNGGVLRNVPVGGGVRKAKRSAKSKSKSTTVPSTSSSAVTVTDSVTVASIPSDPSDLERKSSNSENSSSDSSSRTANTTVTATPVTTTAAEVSRCNSKNSNSAMLINFNESSTRLFNIPQSATQLTTVDPSILKQSCGGNMSSEIGTFRSLMKSWNDEGIQKTENDQIQIQMERDWEDNEGLFDQSYWSQNQWNDDDHHLLNYLP